jgi:hypothetical protein
VLQPLKKLSPALFICRRLTDAAIESSLKLSEEETACKQSASRHRSQHTNQAGGGEENTGNTNLLQCTLLQKVPASLFPLQHGTHI